MMKFNQEGFIEGPYLLFLLFTTTLMLIHLHLVSTQYKKFSGHLKQTLCLKEYLVDINQLISKINRLNQGLKMTSNLSSISFLIPGGLSTSLTLEKIKKIIKETQNALHLKHLISLKTHYINGCRPPMNLNMTPYKMNGLRLLRDAQDLTILRYHLQNSIWDTPLEKYYLKVNFDSSLSTKMKATIL